MRTFKQFKVLWVFQKVIFKQDELNVSLKLTYNLATFCLGISELPILICFSESFIPRGSIMVHRSLYWNWRVVANFPWPPAMSMIWQPEFSKSNVVMSHFANLRVSGAYGACLPRRTLLWCRLPRGVPGALAAVRLIR